MTKPTRIRGLATTVLCAMAVVCLCFGRQTLAAQDQPAATFAASASAGISSSTPQLVPHAGSKIDTSHPVLTSIFSGNNANPKTEKPLTVAGKRRITLDEAQQQAAAANNPLFRLATFGVEAAKQHRLGVQSDFFPKLSSTFANLHFNKFMGEVFLVRTPRRGNITWGVPLVFKDETVAAATVVQPITPVFKIHEVLKIARADEQVAKAKAALPAKEVANNVEQSYFELLVSQRLQEVAEVEVKQVENKWQLASASTLPAGLAEHESEWLEASKAVVQATSKVKEATAALNTLLGWPADTKLELVIPPAFDEDISAAEAAAEAMRNNPEVVEAEQTLVKARAVSKLSKLEYVPDVAVVGGYAYQKVFPVLPTDFSYVGVTANYNLFDFGKRERTIKERSAQVSMAEIGLQLVKAKVAATVTKAYFELESARQLSELARRMDVTRRTMEVRYGPEEARAAKAKAEAEMLQAELDHRLAYSRLEQLTGGTGFSSGK